MTTEPKTVRAVLDEFRAYVDREPTLDHATVRALISSIDYAVFGLDGLGPLPVDALRVAPQSETEIAEVRWTETHHPRRIVGEIGKPASTKVSYLQGEVEHELVVVTGNRRAFEYRGATAITVSRMLEAMGLLPPGAVSDAD